MKKTPETEDGSFASQRKTTFVEVVTYNSVLGETKSGTMQLNMGNNKFDSHTSFINRSYDLQEQGEDRHTTESSRYVLRIFLDFRMSR